MSNENQLQSKDEGIYNQNQQKVTNILNVWQAIELLTPALSEKFRKYIKTAQTLKANENELRDITDRAHESFLLSNEPFKKEVNKEIAINSNEDAIMYWHAYVGYIDWSKAEDKISRIIDNKPPPKKEELDDITIMPIAGLCMDRDGKLIADSLTISSAAYVFGQILKLGDQCNIDDIINFKDEISAIAEEVNCKILLRDIENNITTPDMLDIDIIGRIASYIAKRLGVDTYLVKKNNVEFPELCIRKVIVVKKLNKDKLNNALDEETSKIIVRAEADSKYPPSLEMFNSFFLDQIIKVKNNIKNIKAHSAIGKYLGMFDEPKASDLLQDHDILKALFHAEKRPASRWPSNSTHALALLQEGALNVAMANFAHSNEQLLAINGPPGTGKTTLMSDLIVNIYVARAKKLAELNNHTEGLSTKNNYRFEDSYNCTFKHNIRELSTELQGYEIVVASSNNNAVENITKEIKLKKNIHASYIEEFKLFDWLDQKNSIWGMFAAILGNSRNRENFKEVIAGPWKIDPKKKPVPNLLQYLELLKNSSSNLQTIKEINPRFDERNIDIKWDEAKNNFNNLNTEIQDIYTSIDSFIDISHKEAAILQRYPSGLKVERDKIQAKKYKIFGQLKHYLIELKKLKEIFVSTAFDGNLWWHQYFNTDKHKTFINNQNISKTELKIIDQEIIQTIQDMNNFDEYDLNISDNSSMIDINKEYITQDITWWQRLSNAAKYQQYKLEKNRLFRFIESTSEKIKSLRDYDLKIINDNLKNIDDSAILIKLVRTKEAYLIEQGFDIEEIKQDKYWQNNDLDHKRKPYVSQKFEQKRTKLFTYAIKLHELFIEANSKHFWCAIKSYFQIGSRNHEITPEIAKAAWQSLFMIVPVVSTTFHSFSRTFNYLEQANLGWLIIDEAGQAPPQYAAYAIYLCKNVVIVGDPMQTEPINILGEKMINSFFESKDIEPSNWSPHAVSAQILADRNSLYQTQYKNSKVGFPLIVHRRCTQPMFGIINKIIYDNKMISATNNSSSVINQSLGKSRWLNVEDDASIDSKFSELEYQLLIEHLKKLVKFNSNLIMHIYIITMFVDYKQEIQKRLREENWRDVIDARIYFEFKKQLNDFIKSHIGTIHAFQGKENDTVIMMLGAQGESHSGARAIMTAKTNVMNVGISRAKNNLYIIGSRSKWSRNGFMQEVISELDIYERNHNIN